MVMIDLDGTARNSACRVIAAVRIERPARCPRRPRILRDPMTISISLLMALLRGALLSRINLALEKAALRQQLTIHQRNQKHPKLRTEDRVFWILLRWLWSGWERSLLVVRSDAVIAWHRQGCKLIWRRRSRGRRVGRPRIPREHWASVTSAAWPWTTFATTTGLGHRRRFTGTQTRTLS